MKDYYDANDSMIVHGLDMHKAKTERAFDNAMKYVSAADMQILCDWKSIAMRMHELSRNRSSFKIFC